MKKPTNEINPFILQKNIWIPSQNGEFLNSLHPKEKGYYSCTFTGWALGSMNEELCLWCGRVIPETRKKDPRVKKSEVL